MKIHVQRLGNVIAIIRREAAVERFGKLAVRRQIRNQRAGSGKRPNITGTRRNDASQVIAIRRGDIIDVQHLTL